MKTNILNDVFDTVASILHVDANDLTTDSGLGETPSWDSLAHLEILSQIEKKYEVAFLVEDTFEIESINDIIETLNKYLG